MTKKISNRDWENLSAYLDGQLPPKRQARFAARLESEPALRDAYDSLRNTRSMLRNLPRLRAPRNFTLTPEMVGIPRRRRRLLLVPTFQFASALASLLLLLVLTGDLLGLGNLAPGNQRLAPSPTEVVMLQEAPAAEEEVSEAQVTPEAEVDTVAGQTPLAESVVEKPEEALEEQAEELVAPMIEFPRGVTTTVTEEELAVKAIPESVEVITQTEPSEEEDSVVLGSEEAPLLMLEETSYPLPSMSPQTEILPETTPYLPYIRIAEISLAFIAVSTGFAAYYLRQRG